MTEQEATVWARERIARGRLSKPNSKKRDRALARYKRSHGGLSPMRWEMANDVTSDPSAVIRQSRYWG